MTVEELIQILQRIDPKLPVMTYNQYGSIENINEIKELHWDEGDKLLVFNNPNK